MKVFLNQEEKGEYFLVIAPDNDIWIRQDDFNKSGLKRNLGEEISFDNEVYVSLKSIQRLQFKLNEEDVSLRMTAPADLFMRRDINVTYERSYNIEYARDNAAFLNYSILYDYRDEEPIIDIASEVGISSGDVLGLSTFAYQKTSDSDKAVRLLTSLTINSRESLRTTIFGDFAASSGLLGSGAILGGINISRNFTIDPFFKKFPPIRVSGELDTPSQVNVYLDGTAVRSERLSPGEFTFHDMPATVGLGRAKIIIDDISESQRIISIPYYYTNRLLKKGLHEYSYSIGFKREKLGEKSFSYGKLAFLAFHNIGLSNVLKVGLAAEGSSDIFNAGPSASFLLANAGVLEAVCAFSNASGESGFSGFLGYSFQKRNFNINFSGIFSSSSYSNLVINPSDDKVEMGFNGSIGFGGKKIGFVTAEYTYSDLHQSAANSRMTFSYNKLISDRTTFFMTASEIKDSETYYEIFTGVHIYFGNDVSSSLSYISGDGTNAGKFSVQKNLPVGNGFGYGADVISSENDDRIKGNIRYQNSSGIYGLDYSNAMRDDGFAVSASGGVGYIDKSIFFSRPIDDSFAKVKVSNLDDVRVYYYGNEVGTTKRGEFIIPNLRSYHDNRIDINNQDIPIFYSIDSLSKYVSPPNRGGTVVKFEVNKIQGIFGNIYTLKNTKMMPVEFAMMTLNLPDGERESFIGRGGEFYVENIPTGKYAGRVVKGDKECVFNVAIPDSSEALIDLGKVICKGNK